MKPTLADLNVAADVQLIAKIVDHKFGGQAGVPDTWAERFGVYAGKPGEEPSKTTISRWCNGRWPRYADDLLRWADILDLDPFALLTIPDEDFAAFAHRLAAKFAIGNLEKANLVYFRQMITPGPVWPPDDMIFPALGQTWYVCDIKHDPNIRRNFMACIHIHTPDWDGISPRTFHFAYRRDIPQKPFWTPYGMVIRHESRARLYHTSGFCRQRPVDALDDPTRVGTEFGPGPAIFRICSLRPFRARIGPDAPLDAIVHFGSPST